MKKTQTLVTNPLPPTNLSWWYSTDGKRGFCWDEVVAHDFRVSVSEGNKATLYLYIRGGIMHLSGDEANKVFEELKKRGK